MNWTPEMEARLRFLSTKGWSYSEIGRDLRVSRSAIAGKISRLGIARTPGDGMARRLGALASASRSRSVWTAEMDAALREMVAQDATTRSVEHRLGVARSTVNARVKKLGLKWNRQSGGQPRPRRDPSVPKPKPEPKPKTSSDFDAARAKASASFLAPAPADAIPLVGRAFGQCAWPVGTPDTPGEQLCCGHAVQEGSRFQYCPDHMRLSFQPGTARPGDFGKMASIGTAPAPVQRDEREPDLWDMAA